MFEHIFFDLDGTLTNPKDGILNSLRYALDKMGITDYRDKNLNEFIGPPLQVGFKKVFGFNKVETKRAVEQFREYYSEHGVYENEPYPGVLEMLADLCSSGKKSYVVTSKLEKYARIVLEHFEFMPYLEDMIGADYSGELATKSKLIGGIMDRYRIAPGPTVVMVGDTRYDMQGARESGISKVAVCYGFGYPEELKEYDPEYFVDNIDELYGILVT